MKIKKNFLFLKKTKRMRVKLNKQYNDSIGFPTYFPTSRNYPTPQNLSLNQSNLATNSNSNHISRKRLVSVSSVSLSWENINVYSRRQNKCCGKICDDTISKTDSNTDLAQSFEMQSVSSGNSYNKNARHQILHNGTIFHNSFKKYFLFLKSSSNFK